MIFRSISHCCRIGIAKSAVRKIAPAFQDDKVAAYGISYQPWNDRYAMLDRRKNQSREQTFGRRGNSKFRDTNFVPTSDSTSGGRLGCILL